VVGDSAPLAPALAPSVAAVTIIEDDSLTISLTSRLLISMPARGGAHAAVPHYYAVVYVAVGDAGKPMMHEARHALDLANWARHKLPSE
jgi:hypothetical protein